MHAFSLRHLSALPGPAKLDYKLPSLLSLMSGQTGPIGFTQQQTPRSAPFESTRPAHAFGNVAVHATAPVQTKLTVNRPGDRYEREADAVTDQVMRMPAGPAAPEPSTAQPAVSERANTAAVQRLAAHIDPSLDEIEIRPRSRRRLPRPRRRWHRDCGPPAQPAVPAPSPPRRSRVGAARRWRRVRGGSWRRASERTSAACAFTPTRRPLGRHGSSMRWPTRLASMSCLALANMCPARPSGSACSLTS